MPKVSVNILTKDRANLLQAALNSVVIQSFRDLEIVVVNDGSTDLTDQVVKGFTDDGVNIKYLRHPTSLGITKSRQEALAESSGEYVAILDDDDEWVDRDKLKKQVEFLDYNPKAVLVGGAIQTVNSTRQRPQTDQAIRQTMLLKNNFFTSTVLFRRAAALSAGGFLVDGPDLAEDYDLWLRLGKVGSLFNFREVFVKYRLPGYNKGRFKQFLSKQLALIEREKDYYPHFWLAKVLLQIRLIF